MSSSVRTILSILIYIFAQKLSAANYSKTVGNLHPEDPAYSGCIQNVNTNLNFSTQLYAVENYFLNYSGGRQFSEGIVVYYFTKTAEENYIFNSSTNCTYFMTIEPILNEKIYTSTTDYSQKACGSFINFKDKYYSESIPLSGTDFGLTYQSIYNDQSKLTHVIKGVSGVYRSGYPVKYKLQDQTYDFLGGPVLDMNQYLFYWNGIGGQTIENDFFKSTQLYFSYNIEYQSEILENTNPIRFSIVKNSIEIDSKNIYILKYKPKVWGLGGWTLNHHHFFHIASKKLFTGFGEIVEYENFKIINHETYGQVYALIDRNNGKLVYYFDTNGRHLETKNLLTNTVISKFAYSVNNFLVDSTDQFGNKLEFIRNSAGDLTKIKYNNLEYIVELDDKKLIHKLTTLSGKSYLANYDSQNQLIQFTNIDQIVTNFNLDEYGQIVSETKNNGVIQSFLDQVSENLVAQIHSVSNFVAQKYHILRNSDGLITQQINDDGTLAGQKQNYFKLAKETISTGATQISNVLLVNSDWSSDYKPVSNSNLQTSESLQNLNINLQFNQSQSYTNNTTQIELNNRSYSTYVNNSLRELEYFDIANRQFMIRNLDGSYNYYSISSHGQITTDNSAYSYPKTFSYYPNGKLQKIQKGTHWTSYSYDQYGYLSAITNSKNQTTTFTNDSDGNVLTQTLPNGDQIQFEYTSGNNIKKIITPNGQVHLFNRTLGDYLVSALTPNQKTTSYQYDNDRRITEIEKPSGKKITYNYKPQSPDLQSITTPSGTITVNQIDPQGRLKSSTSADQIRLDTDWVYTYPQKYTWYDENNEQVGQIEFNYKSDEFKIREIKVNNQKVADMNYDYTGRIYGMNIGSPVTQFASYQYPNSGFTTATVSTLNGLQATYSTIDDNQGNQPTALVNAQIKENPNLQLFLTMKRTFDTFGNASEFTLSTLKTDTGIYNNYYTLTPTYDANDRLVQITKNRKSYINNTEINSTDFINNYLYPPASNNNVKEYAQQSLPTTQPHKRTVATHSIDDQLTKLRGSINRDYQYTDDGDLKSMTNCFGTTNYDYDVFGNLKKVTLPDNKIIEYKVDSQNRRIKKLINGQIKEYYLWYDQLKLAAILDENKSPKLIYIYGPESQNTPSYVIHNNTTYKILHDPGLGSVRYVIEPTTQQIVQEIEYDEFGNMMKNSNPDFQPILFSGGLYDFDTKLYRFGARDYDPTVGRWTTKDPIGFAGGDTNLYAYVGGNPMSYVDPSGLKVDGPVYTPVDFNNYLNSPSGTSAIQNGFVNSNFRYIYTNQGVMDMRHVQAAYNNTQTLINSGLSPGLARTLTNTLGLGVEIFQALGYGSKSYGNKNSSAFSPEDIPSNAFGANGASLHSNFNAFVGGISNPNQCKGGY